MRERSTPPAILLRSGLTDSGVGTGLCDHPAAAFTLQLRDPSGAGALATSGLLDLDPIQVLPVDHLGADAPPELAVLLVALMRPLGRSGGVWLASDDPTVHPHVDFDLLSDERDVEHLCDGVEAAISLLQTARFRAAVESVFIDDVGTPISALEDRTAIADWLRHRSADYVHAASSMADAVGPDGRVTGHEGLTVADASAFPTIPNVNTHVPTMMLAERFVQQWIVTDR